MERTFQSIVDAVPLIKELFQDDTAVTIENSDEMLFISESKSVKVPVKVGDKVETNMVRERMKAEKKTINVVLTKEEHGVDVKITNIPIRDYNGEIIGSFSLIRNTERENSVRNISKELMTSLRETNFTINEVAHSALELSDNLNSIIKKTEETTSDIEKSNELVTIIKNVSQKTNMLGLNAAIESARAGEYGRGFSVVATEMRKLSSMSGESTKKIESYLTDMKCSIVSIARAINILGEIATTQAANIEEISATLEQIGSNSQKLVEEVQ